MMKARLAAIRPFVLIVMALVFVGTGASFLVARPFADRVFADPVEWIWRTADQALLVVPESTQLAIVVAFCVNSLFRVMPRRAVTRTARVLDATSARSRTSIGKWQRQLAVLNEHNFFAQNFGSQFQGLVDDSVTPADLTNPDGTTNVLGAFLFGKPDWLTIAPDPAIYRMIDRVFPTFLRRRHATARRHRLTQIDELIKTLEDLQPRSPTK